ncbi:hypothetical protein FAIPA1_400034 [Frankia sp. AiPs1]
MIDDHIKIKATKCPQKICVSSHTCTLGDRTTGRLSGSILGVPDRPQIRAPRRRGTPASAWSPIASPPRC